MNPKAYFEYVRDWPYRINTEPQKASQKFMAESLEKRTFRDPQRNMPSLEQQDYSCVGKHNALGMFFAVEEMEIRFRVCDFTWSEIKAIPKSILAIPHNDAISHVYLEAKINGKWIKVDATWDSGLKKVLPVNYWDGKSNTKIAVPSHYTYSPKESEKIMNQEEDLAADLKKNKVFYTAINEWLDKVRKG